MSNAFSTVTLPIRKRQELNKQLALRVIEAAVKRGVTRFCFCPGSRNSPLFSPLMEDSRLEKYFWFEERSAAFFALGKSRAAGAPVAVVTTSGTASAELLPAAMEAYYTGAPLLLLTADRPRRFRGSGAPQAAEHLGLFGIYAPFAQDIADEERCDLEQWDCRAPAHLNVCFEDPVGEFELSSGDRINSDGLDQFLEEAKHPLVVVSALPPESRQAVADFLLKLRAPAILEGVSGLREEKKLQHLRIARTDNLWSGALQMEYPIDGVLRIGGVPTVRLWRDLEDKIGQVLVCSISNVPFSGLSWGEVIAPMHGIGRFFEDYTPVRNFSQQAQKWQEADKIFRQKLLELFEKEPLAEPSLVHQLSKRIPSKALVYLGNSLPIREWDLAACHEDRELSVNASRGLSGIDGQISTFLGQCRSSGENWAILGDLTALYDLAGPWILPQLTDVRANIVIINNGGGQIFGRLYNDPRYCNPHHLNFAPFAKLWELEYAHWTQIPAHFKFDKSCVIEITPDADSSARFWQELKKI